MVQIKTRATLNNACVNVQTTVVFPLPGFPCTRSIPGGLVRKLSMRARATFRERKGEICAIATFVDGVLRRDAPLNRAVRWCALFWSMRHMRGAAMDAVLTAFGTGGNTFVFHNIARWRLASAGCITQLHCMAAPFPPVCEKMYPLVCAVAAPHAAKETPPTDIPVAVVSGKHAMHLSKQIPGAARSEWRQRNQSKNAVAACTIGFRHESHGRRTCLLRHSRPAGVHQEQ